MGVARLLRARRHRCSTSAIVMRYRREGTGVTTVLCSHSDWPVTILVKCSALWASGSEPTSSDVGI